MSGDPTAAAPILTDSVIAGLSNGKIVPSEVGATIPGVTEGKKAQFIYELCDAIVQGRLPTPTEHFDVAMQAAGITPSDGLADVLANTFWLMTMQLGEVHDSDARLQRLVELVDVAKKKKWVDKQLLVETQEATLLDATGLVPPPPGQNPANNTFLARERKFMTQRLFKQNKFNLFREDNEGYAKLVALLGSTHLGPDTFQPLVAEMKALIGTFELDPNRVAAVVLVAGQEDPHNLAYMDLLPLFNHEAPLQMLGFKLINDGRADAADKASPGFYIVAAQLIKAGIVTLEQLLPYMGTTMDQLAQQVADTLEAALVHAGVKVARAAPAVKKEVKEVKEEADKEPKDGGGSAADRRLKKFSVAAPSAGSASQPQGFGPRALDLSVVEYMGPWADPGAQQLGLLRGLLEVQDMEHGLMLFSWLRLKGVHPVHDAGVRGVLARQLREALNPLSAGLYPDPMAAESKDSKGRSSSSSSRGKYLHLPEEVYTCVELLGVYACADGELLQLLMLVLARHMEEAVRAGREVQEEKMAKLEPLLARCILPGLCLAPGLTIPCQKAWDLLQALPYQRRFLMYTRVWEVQREDPICVLAGQKAVEEVKRINRRSVASGDKNNKELNKEVGRAIARRYQRIMAGLPLAALDAAVNWSINAVSQEEVTSEGLRYIPDMALDALTFLLLHNLGSLKATRGKVKEDGYNLADWIARLAKFVAAVYKRLPEVMESLAVGAYLARSLRAANSLDVVVLQELLERACGITLTTAVDADKRPYLACSALVRHLRCSQGYNCCDKAAANCMQALVDQLQVNAPPGEALALPLFVLLGQQLGYALYTTRTEEVLLVQHLHHRVHTTLLEWIQVLHMGLSKDQLAALLPTPAQLVGRYGVPLEFAMSLWRPLLHALLPSYGNEEGEEGEVPEGGEGAGGASDLLASLATFPRVAGLTLSSFKEGLEGLGAHQKWQAQFARDELFLAFWGMDLQDLVFQRRLYDQVVAEQQKVLADLEAPFTVKRTNLERLIEERKMTLRRAEDVFDQANMQYSQGGYRRAPIMQGGGGMHHQHQQQHQITPHQADMNRVRAAQALHSVKEDLRKHLDDGEEKLRDECDPIQKRIKVLRSDMKDHERRHHATHARLAAEKDVFIALAPSPTSPEAPPAPSSSSQPPEAGAAAAAATAAAAKAGSGYGSVVSTVLATCVLPRALMSLEDALYCHQFGWALYELNTPGWSSITYWDRLVKSLVLRIPTSTGEEADCLSLLLEETMGVLERWRKDKAEYGRQLAINQTLVANKPGKAASASSAATSSAAAAGAGGGAAAAARPSSGSASQPAASAAAAAAAAAATAGVSTGGLLRPTGNNVQAANWGFLAGLCGKIQDNLTTTFLSALNSGDRMQQRTAVGIMSNLFEVYPLVSDNHTPLVECLEDIRASLPQHDSMATSTISLITKLNSHACTSRLVNKWVFKGIPEPKTPKAPAAAQQPTAGRKQPAGRAPSEERPAKKLRVDAPEFKPGTQQPRKQEGGSTAAGGSAAAGSSRGRQPIKPPPAGGSRAPAASSSNPPPPKQPQQQQRREEASVGSRAAGYASAAGEAAGRDRDRDRGDDKRKPAAGEGGGGNKRARVEQASSDMEPGELPAPGAGRPSKAPGGMAGATLAKAGLVKGKEGGDRQQQQQQQQQPKRTDGQRTPQQQQQQQQPKQEQQDKGGKEGGRDKEQRDRERDSSRPRGAKESRREGDKDRGGKEAGKDGAAGSSKPPTSSPAAEGGTSSKQQQPPRDGRARDKPPQPTKGDAAGEAGDAAGDAKAAHSKRHGSSRARGGGGSDAEGGPAHSDAAATPASSAGDGKGERRREKHRDREHHERHKDKGEGKEAAAQSPKGGGGGSTPSRGGGETPEQPAKGGEGHSSRHHHKDKERDKERHRDREHHKEKDKERERGKDRDKDKEKGREHKGSGSGRHAAPQEGGSRPASPDKRDPQHHAAKEQQQPQQQQPPDKGQERPRHRDKEGGRRGDKGDAAGDAAGDGGKPPRHRGSGGDRGGAAAEGDATPAAAAAAGAAGGGKGGGEREAGHKRVRDRSSDRQQPANGAVPSPAAADGGQGSKAGRSGPAAADGGGDAASPHKGDGKHGRSSSRRDKGGSSHRDKERGDRDKEGGRGDKEAEGDGKGASRRGEASPDSKRRKVEPLPAASAASQPDKDSSKPSRSSRGAGGGGAAAARDSRDGGGGGGGGGGQDADGQQQQQQAVAPPKRRHAPILPPSPLPGPPQGGSSGGGGGSVKSAPKRTSR